VAVILSSHPRAAATTAFPAATSGFQALSPLLAERQSSSNVVRGMLCAARQKLAQTVVPWMMKTNLPSTKELQTRSNHTAPAAWFPMDGHAFAVGTPLSSSSGSPYVFVRQVCMSRAQTF